MWHAGRDAGKLNYLHGRMCTEHLIMYGPQSRASHDATMAKIALFGREVLPVVGSIRRV